MSNDGKHGLLKFISVLGSKNKEREFVDYSTERSRTQTRQKRPDKTNKSYLPSPSLKRKRSSLEGETKPKREALKRTK